MPFQVKFINVVSEVQNTETLSFGNKQKGKTVLNYLLLFLFPVPPKWCRHFGAIAPYPESGSDVVT